MNKLFGLFLLALACWAPSAANAAACFWVGGTGNINDTSKWMTASGGATPCAAAGGWPNSIADTGTLDAASGGGTITRNVNWTIGTLNISAFTGTFGNTTDTATVNLNTFTNSGSGTRTLNLGASTWTCGQNTFCNWVTTGATNLTLVASTSTIVLTNFGGAFNPGATPAPTYNVVTFNGGVQGTSYTWNGSGTTIPTLNINGAAYFFMQNAQSVSVTNLNFTGGSLSSWVAFATSASNSQFTFTLANPATCSYCIFRNITTSAAPNNITASQAIDNGANVNITFSSVPSGGGSCPGRIIGGENKFKSPIPSRSHMTSLC
jgi:hypothetical protein